MATIIKELRLIKVEQTDEVNSYKYWNAQLYDDGKVKAQWARVGAANPQSGEWNGGEAYLEKKKREKEKKGYVEQKTVGSVATAGKVVKVDNNLHEIAKNQIIKNTSNSRLTSLIDRLVKANIHTITSSTNVTFNDATGLFSTPLGIVTPDGIREARDILADIHPLVKKGNFDTKLNGYVNKYVLIIPQNLGMKRFNAETVFPDEDAVKAQSNILDSLEASYQAMTKNPNAPAKDTLESVFKVDLDVLSDTAEWNRLDTYFKTSRKSMHNYDHVKVREIYKIDIHDMSKSFNDNLSPIKEVFHGTSQANCLSILKSGLKVSPPSTAAIAGKLWGNGVYGAINSSKSMGYTFGRWGQGSSDTGWLFICDFAMGKIFYPTSYSGNLASGHDSVWAKASSTGLHNDELIVYKNSQCKIKYLLEVK